MELITNLFRKIIVVLTCTMLCHLQINLSNNSISFGLSHVYAAETVVTNTTDKGEEGYIQLDGKAGGLGSAITSPAVSILVYMASAFIIYKMIVACKPVSYDVYAAAAGAGIYIMGEVMNISSSKEKLKEKKLEYKTYSDDAVVDNEQYEALIKEKQMMEKVKSSAGKRAKMQMASAVAFGVAAGLAMFEDVKSKTLASICTAMGSGVAAACASPSCGVASKMVSGKEIQESVIMMSKAQLTKLKAKEAGVEGLLTACAAESSKTSALDGGACIKAASDAGVTCNKYLLNEQLTEIACLPLSLAKANHKSENHIESWFTGLMKSMVPSAKAVGGSILGGIAGVLSGYLAVQSKWADMFITTPTKRAWLWGGLAAYGMIVYKNTKEQESSAGQNIVQIDALLKRMDNTMAKGISVSNSGPGTSVTGTSTFSVAGASFDEPMACIAGKSSDGACKKLPPVKTNPQMTANYGNMPKGLAPAFGDLLSFAKATEGKSGISKGAAQKLDRLSNRLNAVNSTLRSEQKKLDAARKKLGMKPARIGDNGKKMFNNMVKRAKKHFDKKEQNPNSLLARLGASAPRPSKSSGSDAKAAEKNLVKDIGLTESDGSGALASGDDSDIPSFDFDMNALENEVAKRNTEFDEMAKKAEYVEEQEESIIQDRSVSIFKVLSVRYLKSGYKKLLEEVKE